MIWMHSVRLWQSLIFLKKLHRQRKKADNGKKKILSQDMVVNHERVGAHNGDFSNQSMLRRRRREIKVRNEAKKRDSKQVVMTLR